MYSKIILVFSLCGFFLMSDAMPTNGDSSDEETFSRRQRREITKLRYKDCGKENRAMRFDHLALKPIPIEIPGFIDLRLVVNVTQSLPERVDVRVALKKKYFGSVWQKLPCLPAVGFGSCRYRRLDTCILTQDILGCPVQSGYHTINQRYMVPDLENAIYAEMLKGEYKAIVRVRHPKKRTELACLMAHFSLTA